MEWRIDSFSVCSQTSVPLTNAAPKGRLHSSIGGIHNCYCRVWVTKQLRLGQQLGLPPSKPRPCRETCGSVTLLSRKSPQRAPKQSRCTPCSPPPPLLCAAAMAVNAPRVCLLDGHGTTQFCNDRGLQGMTILPCCLDYSEQGFGGHQCEKEKGKGCLSF